MELTAIRVTLNPSDSCWQLPLESLGGRPVCLVGWVLEAPRLDAGVPREAAAILVRSIVAHSYVTFLDEEFMRNAAVKFPLRTTAEPASAMHMFETVRFAWDRMTQFAFLSPLDQPPPRIRDEQVRGILNHVRFDPARLLEAGVGGLLLPAVDGDFAAVCFFDESLPVFLAALQQECVTSGVAFEVVPETQFKSAAWYAGSVAPGASK